MEYFKINYKKLQNLYQFKYHIFIITILILFIFLLILGYLKKIEEKDTFYGIYDDGMIKFKINVVLNDGLSDKLKNNNHLLINNKEISYEFIGFEDYEIIDNNIYQIVDLKVDGGFYSNEVLKIELCYRKERIITYILELFK